MQLESVCSIPIQDYLCTRLAFTPDGHHIVIGHRDLYLHNILSGKTERTFAFEGLPGEVSFSPDGRYMACANQNDSQPQTRGLVKVFEVESGETVFQARTNVPVEAACLAWSAERPLLVYKDSVPDESRSGAAHWRNQLRVCALPDGELVREWDLGGWAVRALASSQAGLCVFGVDAMPAVVTVEGAGLHAYRFKVGTSSLSGDWVGTPRDLGFGIGAFALSPDGRYLGVERISVRENRRNICVIETATGQEQCLIGVEPDVVAPFQFSSDASVFVALSEDQSTSENVLRIWDAKTLEPLAETPFGNQYHAIAAHWKTCRLAALGDGKCDISLLHL